MDELLAEVLRDASAMTARSVLADHLQSIGDPRGELIATSCLLADLGDDDPRRPALARRELALIREHLPAWATELGLAPTSAIAIVRGFPDRIDAPAHELRRDLTDRIPLAKLTMRQVSLATLAELCSSTATPTVQDLTLYNGDDDLRPAAAHLARAPWLAQLRALRTWDLPITDLDLATFLASPHLPHLDTLELGGFARDLPITPDGLAAAVAMPEFRRLRALGLTKVPLGIRGVRCLVDAPHTDRLERLLLDECTLDVDSLQLLLDAALPSLTSLTFRDPFDAGAIFTLGSSLADTLRRLHLNAAQLDDAWARAFVAPRPRALTHLALRNSHLTTDGLAILLEHLPLASLAAGMSPITRWGRDLASLVDRPAFANLRALDATMTEVTADGVDALAHSPHARNLRHLRLAHDPIGPEGAQALANHTTLDQLEALDLGYTKLGDDGVEELCNSERLANLRYLSLSGLELGERGYAALARTRAFPNLQVLRLYEAEEPRRSELEQHLGALIDLGDFTESMGRWPSEYE